MIEGVLLHNYVNASDDIGAYQADQCNRQAVTAEWAFEHLVDETLYVYRTDDAHGESGFDPWLTIDGGMDKLKDNGMFVLIFGRTGELVVDPKFRVFASKSKVARVLQKAGLDRQRATSDNRQLVTIWVNGNNQATVRGFLSMPEIAELTRRCAAAPVDLSIEVESYPLGLEAVLDEQDENRAQDIRSILEREEGQ